MKLEPNHFLRFHHPDKYISLFSFLLSFTAFISLMTMYGSSLIVTVIEKPLHPYKRIIYLCFNLSTLVCIYTRKFKHLNMPWCLLFFLSPWNHLKFIMSILYSSIHSSHSIFLLLWWSHTHICCSFWQFFLTYSFHRC